MSFVPDAQSRWFCLKSQEDALTSLTYETALIRYLPTIHDLATQPAEHKIIHAYPIQKATVLLGAKDTRLPNYKEARQFLQAQNYQVLVRPHGGLGIVCDPGIVNLSLIQDSRYQNLNIDQAYQQFVELIQYIFEDYPLRIEAYEMANSYCPGKYDLIIQNKKIGGLAQRRFRNGVTTAAYLSLNGDQEGRGQLMKAFYQRGQADTSYPNVDPHSMANLSDFLAEEFTLADFNRLLQDKIVFAKESILAIEADSWQDALSQAQKQLHPSS
ncbi:hypothetical protein M0R79_03830 [Ignavigranum ruoffiae]|uniref:lipoate--protein ligase family protein n=1 Tax=Ignavigranum ruoffiae TaxID=89093 RepID=UPI0020604429|nr:hypothetical protein [Ignavigranum ruoffiae]UPQ86514.1 hypothetical protein M0R79_03830 [Ignavigranum ruoffiae]